MEEMISSGYRKNIFLKNALLKKIGFYTSLNNLPNDTNPIKLNDFLEELKRKGIRYDFYRNRERMVEKGLIEIHNDDIRLTERGLKTKEAISNLINIPFSAEETTLDKLNELIIGNTT